jgi:putative ABC transport system substrate-binding protein
VLSDGKKRPTSSFINRRAAVYVDKILKGANPATLPVETPQLELVIILKTAEKIGVKIPPEILLEANEVIK